ncbi:hypothetical protein ACP4OV_007681 [Aristida adscensionis]
MTTKRRRSGGRDRGRAAQRSRKHLYLVFDDWLCGYSVRKVDLGAAADSDSDESNATQLPSNVAGGDVGDVPRLPPAVIRFEAPRGLPHYFTAAFGNRIMAMHPAKADAGEDADEGEDDAGDGEPNLQVPHSVVPMFDLRTRGIAFGPRPIDDPSRPIYIPVRDKLFALADGSLEQLWPPPLEYTGGDNWCWQWVDLQNPPFERQHVTSYAVHPDRRTILVSTGGWRPHGEWALPFAGRGHFNGDLDAFVGLPRDPGTLGHLCSCDVVPANAGDAPALKLSKEKLFGEDPAGTHIGATLVYLGSRGRFCIVECLSVDDGGGAEDELEESDAPRPCRHRIRLITFSLRYDKNGDLTAGKSRRVKCYKVPKASTEFLLKNPVAFWL